MPPSSPRRPLRTEHDLSRDDGIRAAYSEHGAELYRFALRQLDDEGSATDVVQETFVRAWRAADRFDPSLASLRVWLFAIARNLVVDERRRRAARPVTPQPPDLLTELGPVTDNADDKAVLSWLVEEALQRIRPEARSALVETYLRGRPYAEVAAEQGVPVGTLRSRVFYALELVDPARLDRLPAAPPRWLEESVLAAVRAEPRRIRPWRRRLATAAAVLVIGGAGTGLGYALAPDPPKIPLEPVQVTTVAAGVRSTAQVVPHTWGMEIKLAGTGFDAGKRYHVIVVDSDGGIAQAGEFIGTGTKPMLCNLNSSVLRADARAFEVRDETNQVVLRGQV